MLGSQLEGSEDVVHLIDATVKIHPCILDPTLRAIREHLFKGKDATTMVIIPTANQKKVELIKKFFQTLSDEESRTISFKILRVDSEVGEQPYDDAGRQGAENRIKNAVVAFAQDDENLKKLQSDRVGQLHVVAIENFIWMNDLEMIPATKKVTKAVDFGIVAIHDVVSGRTGACMSNGVTISKSYINAAREKGFEDEGEIYGKVTVGECIAAKYAGVDKANWHEKLAGESRYALLKEALSSSWRQIESES